MADYTLRIAVSLTSDGDTINKVVTLPNPKMNAGQPDFSANSVKAFVSSYGSLFNSSCSVRSAIIRKVEDMKIMLD